MVITVCIKQVPGTNRVGVDPETGVLKRSGVESKMNPFDLYALETALRIKEKKQATVRVISMGPPQAEEVLREAYAMGADEAILLSDRAFAGSDVLATAYALSQGITAADATSGRSDLIVCGKQTTDGDTAQVGAELSEFLGIPMLGCVKELIALEETGIKVRYSGVRSDYTAQLGFPCLISVDKGIFQPRLPSYVKQRETARRPVVPMTRDDLQDKDETRYGLNGSPTQVKRIFPPDHHDNHELWTGSGDELSGNLITLLVQRKIIGEFAP